MENSETQNSKDKVKKFKNVEETSIPNFLQKTYEILEVSFDSSWANFYSQGCRFASYNFMER